MLIRRYVPDDRDVVRRVHAEAFGRPDDPDRVPLEVEVVDELIEAGDVIEPLSLVAVRDGRVVGHVVCSRATVAAHPVAALGPIAVLPAHQGSGVGQALMHAVLAAAAAIELPLVGLVGSTQYYARFGFLPGARLDIEAPDPTWGDHFQVRALAAYDPSIRGRFRYAPAFGGRESQ